EVAEQGAVLVRQAEALGQVLVHALDLHAEPAANDVALLSELREDLLDLADGNGEAHARGLRNAAAGDDHRVDTDDLAGRVEERSSGIAGVDRRVGLDHVDRDPYAGDVEREPLVGTDCDADAVAGEAERVADGHHRYADLGPLVIAELQDRELLPRLDLDERDVGPRVLSDDLRLVPVTVGKSDGDLIRSVHDVTVGQDVSVAVD